MREVQSFNTKDLGKMEVRMVEEVNLEIGDKVYPRLQIHFDTEKGERLIFTDKDVTRKDIYQRGTVGTLELRIVTENVSKTSKAGSNYIAETIKIEIESFTPSTPKKGK